MAEEEQVAGTLQPGDAREELSLGVLVEVDHHVPAENRIQRSSHRQSVDEIELLESDQRSDFRRDLPADAAGLLPLGEEPLQALGGDIAHPLRGIDSAARALEDLRVEVRGEDPHVPTTGVRQRLEHGHGDGVGLLARGAPRGPDAKPPWARPIGGERREDVLAQILEMMWLAKERGEVRRDRVAELRELLRISLQPLAVLGEAVQLQGAQTPRQPAINELPLLVREMDAGERLDEHTQRLEVLLAEGELPQAQGGAGVARGGGLQG